ncbi:MAG: hypothetical protein ACTSUC_09875 [Promethearchaeota archaeon]
MTKRKLRGRKKLLYEALKAQLGVVTAACNQVGVSRDTHYRWLRTDPTYAQWVDEIQDLTLDFAENALLKQIKEGNITANIFFLKTKGKKRGYIEQQNIKQQVTGNISLTKEELNKLMEVL